jgi:hypothetical protein
MDFGYDVKSNTERRHKRTRFMDGNKAMVDVVISVAFFAFGAKSQLKTDS